MDPWTGTTLGASRSLELRIIDVGFVAVKRVNALSLPHKRI